MTAGGSAEILEGLFRRSAGRLVALLAARLGAHRLDLAEEAVQDAMLRALELWPHRGIPRDPDAWLMSVARNRAIDLLRRETRAAAKAGEVARMLDGPGPPGGDPADDEVRLLLLAAHPDLSPRSRVALALKTVAGFGVREIARALLAGEAAVQQMLVRARRTIRERGLTMEMPVGLALEARLATALDTVYLLFNEGYEAADGELAVRADLCHAAIRLAELLASRPETDRPETHALLALLYFQASRLEARVENGELTPLDAQNRSRWDARLIAGGFRELDRAATGTRVTPWHVEAAIASCHARAARPEDTDWGTILSLYDDLVAMAPSPVTRLNRVVALARVAGAASALRELDDVARHPALQRYPLLPAVLAALRLELGDREGAARALREALARAGTAPARRLLERRLAALEPVTASGSEAAGSPPPPPRPGSPLPARPVRRGTRRGRPPP